MTQAKTYAKLLAPTLALLIGLAAPSQTTAQTIPPPATAPYRNLSLTIEERVADLLPRMTLDEKVSDPGDGPRFNDERRGR